MISKVGKTALAVLALAALGGAGLLFAQSDRGAITGAVRDSSSAVLPGVEVSVTNLGTNQVETATTDNSGLYRVGDLPVGSDLAVVPGAGHLFEEPGALDQVATLAVGWFTRYVADGA